MTGGDSSVSLPAGPTISATTSSSSPSAIAPSSYLSPESERVKTAISSEDISALPRADDAEQHPAVVVRHHKRHLCRANDRGRCARGRFGVLPRDVFLHRLCH